MAKKKDLLDMLMGPPKKEPKYKSLKKKNGEEKEEEEDEMDEGCSGHSKGIEMRISLLLPAALQTK